MDKNLIWMIIGFVGQGFFSARFILQWVMSEIKKQSIIPLGFGIFLYLVELLYLHMQFIKKIQFLL